MLKRVGKTLVRQVVRTLALMLGVTLCMYALIDFAPGDPLSLYVDVQGLSGAEIGRLRHELGLDASLPVRYCAWISRLAQGDFGHSLRSGRPVAGEVWTTGLRTLLLTGCAMFLTLLFASASALLSAFGRHPWLSGAFTSAGYVLSGLPVFWLGYLTIYVAASQWGIFAVMHGGRDGSVDWALFAVPVVVLGLGNGTVAEITRHLRVNLDGVLREDYMRTARARGASLWTHLYKDGVVMPLSSLVASKIPYLLGGAIVVEQVFNWPGMGRLAWQAALDRDYPLLLGVALLSALVVRLAHMAKEMVQVAVNPQLAE